MKHLTKHARPQTKKTSPGSILSWVLLIPFYLLTSANLNAQISGTVVEAGQLSPLIGANVEIAGRGIGTVTDEDGFFIIEPEEIFENDTLVISFLGYREKRIALKDYQIKSIISLNTESLQVGDGIEVYADRIDASRQDIPAITQILNRSQIENLPTGDIKALVQRLPAARLVGNDVDGEFFEIRGSNSNEVNVYVDGILLNSLDFNQRADLSIISPENIDKITMQKGSNFLLYGLGATGGVVHVDSRVPTEISGRFTAKYGEFDNVRISGIFDLPLSDGFSLNYSGTYSQSNPELIFQLNRFDPSITDSYRINTRKQVHNFNGYYVNDEGKLGIKAIYFLGEHRKSDWIDDKQMGILAATYMGSLFGTDNWQIVLNQNLTDETIDRLIPHQSDVKFSFDYESAQRKFHLQKTYTANQTSVTLAYDFLHDELQQSSSMRSSGVSTEFFSELTYDNQHSITAVLNAVDTTSSSENLNWNVFASIRKNVWTSGQNDLVSNFGVRFLYLVGMKRWEVFGNYGKNVRYPSLLENAYVGDISFFGAGSDTKLDKLLPEYISSFEIGASLQIKQPFLYVGRLKVDASIFQSDITNKVLRQPVDNNLFLVQKGKNDSRGLDVAARADEIFDMFSGGASFNLITTSNKLLYAYKPLRNFRTWIEYGQGAGIYANTLVYFDDVSYAWYYDAENNLVTREISSFWDLDLVAGWRSQVIGIGYDIQFSVRNILDNSEYVDYYLKRRYFQVSMSVKY